MYKECRQIYELVDLHIRSYAIPCVHTGQPTKSFKPTKTSITGNLRMYVHTIVLASVPPANREEVIGH